MQREPFRRRRGRSPWRALARGTKPGSSAGVEVQAHEKEGAQGVDCGEVGAAAKAKAFWMPAGVSS
jgi:hypothetical protein